MRKAQMKRGNTLPRERAIHTSGSFVKRIIDVLHCLASLFFFRVAAPARHCCAVKARIAWPIIYRSLRSGKKGQGFDLL